MNRSSIDVTKSQLPEFKIPHEYDFVKTPISEDALKAVLNEGIYQVPTLTKTVDVSDKTHNVCKISYNSDNSEAIGGNPILRHNILGDLKRYETYSANPNTVYIFITIQIVIFSVP